MGYFDLRLNHNQLTGPIPAKLGAINQVAANCTCNNNRLTGSIPAELKGLTSPR